MGNSFSHLNSPQSEASEEKTQSNSNVTVWLDTTYDRNSPKAESATYLALLKVDPYLVTFRDSEKCSDFITNIDADKTRVTLVVSEKNLSDSFDTLIQTYKDAPQIDGIYILCETNEAVAQTFSNLNKMKGIFTDMTQLISTLNRLPHLNRKHREDFVRQDFIVSSFPSVPSNFASTSSSESIQLLYYIQNEKEGEFLYSQLLRDILIDAESSREEMIQFCRQNYAGTRFDSNIIDEFEDRYDPRHAIFWYTRDSFLYRKLNKALRDRDTDTLYSLRYFIRDLHLQLQERHTAQQQMDLSASLSTRVYRGQLMDLDEFNKKIRHQQGDYFSVSSFFSTSLLKEQPALYAGDGSRLLSHNECSVLFEINIDQHVNKFPYANVTNESAFQEGESEVLFTMGAVFRIVSVVEEQSGFWIVKLSLTGEEDEQLVKLHDDLKKVFIVDVPLAKVANVMHTLGMYAQSEQYYLKALEWLRNSEDCHTRAFIHYHLGVIYQRTGQLKKALAHHTTSLGIQLQHCKSTDTLLSNTYNSLGGIYLTQKDYNQALIHLQQALSVRLQNPNPTDTSVVYNNLGMTYVYLGRHDEALSMCYKALEVQEVVLPPNHPAVTTTYNNLAMVYGKQKDYNKQIEFLKRSLQLLQTSLPPKHPCLGQTYFNLALAFLAQGQWKQAFEYWNKTYACNKTRETQQRKERDARLASASHRKQCQWYFLYGFLFSGCYFFLNACGIAPIIIGVLLFLIYKLEFIDSVLTFITGL